MGKGRTTKEIKNDKNREHDRLVKDVSRTARETFQRSPYDTGCKRQCALCKRVTR